MPTEILMNLWPLVVVQTSIQVIALVSLYKRKVVRFDNKWIWLAIILFGGVIGSVAYFYFRGEEYAEDSSED